MQTPSTLLSQVTAQSVTQQLGLVFMALATVVGLVEFSEHRNSKVAITVQPAFVFASDQVGTDTNAQRRERDESAPHYIGYSAFQRTPGRTGKY